MSLPGCHRQASLPGLSALHAVALTFQSQAQQPLNLRFVINRQDRQLVFGIRVHALSSGMFGRSKLGSEIVNAAPPPSRLAAVTLPPCASTNPLTIARPKPVPPGFAFGA